MLTLADMKAKWFESRLAFLPPFSFLFLTGNYTADANTSRDDLGRQMRENKKCPFSGVTSYGRVWRKDAGKQNAPSRYIEGNKMQYLRTAETD